MLVSFMFLYIIMYLMQFQIFYCLVSILFFSPFSLSPLGIFVQIYVKFTSFVGM